MKDDCCAAGSGRKERTCPMCGRSYRDYPAISRLDNVTEICPECGTREALASIGVVGDEAEGVLAAIHRYCGS